MVYNNYPFPQYYPTANAVTYQQQRQPAPSVAYVQGENAAKAYPVTPGQIMYLFDVDQLYNRLSNCPVPSTPVYGRTPIFVPTTGTTTAVG